MQNPGTLCLSTVLPCEAPRGGGGGGGGQEFGAGPTARISHLQARNQVPWQRFPCRTQCIRSRSPWPSSALLRSAPDWAYIHVCVDYGVIERPLHIGVAIKYHPQGLECIYNIDKDRQYNTLNQATICYITDQLLLNTRARVGQHLTICSKSIRNSKPVFAPKCTPLLLRWPQSPALNSVPTPAQSPRYQPLCLLKRWKSPAYKRQRKYYATAVALVSTISMNVGRPSTSVPYFYARSYTSNLNAKYRCVAGI